MWSEQTKREYGIILAAFLDLLDRWDNDAESDMS
jgi:hypothetical protein